MGIVLEILQTIAMSGDLSTGSPVMICFFFLNLTLTDRNMYVKFGLKGFLELWDVDIFDITASFYWTNDARHLWSNLQTPNFFFGKKSLNVLNVKLFSKKNQYFGVSFDAFLFQTLIKGKYFFNLLACYLLLAENGH